MRPLFVMDAPAFLGLPTAEGEERRRQYDGEKTIRAPFRSIYVHGDLEKKVGYDIARFAQGDIKDQEAQRVILVYPGENDENVAVSAILVSVDHTGTREEDTRKRYGFIVARSDARASYEYLLEQKEKSMKNGYSQLFL